MKGKLLDYLKGSNWKYKLVLWAIFAAGVVTLFLKLSLFSQFVGKEEQGIAFKSKNDWYLTCHGVLLFVLLYWWEDAAANSLEEMRMKVVHCKLKEEDDLLGQQLNKQIGDFWKAISDKSINSILSLVATSCSFAINGSLSFA